jgi:hypothetical protein
MRHIDDVASCGFTDGGKRTCRFVTGSQLSANLGLEIRGRLIISDDRVRDDVGRGGTRGTTLDFFTEWRRLNGTSILLRERDRSLDVVCISCW